MNNYPFNDYSSCVSWIETQKRFKKKTSIDVPSFNNISLPKIKNLVEQEQDVWKL